LLSAIEGMPNGDVMGRDLLALRCSMAEEYLQYYI
jgi:hypothetical protein